MQALLIDHHRLSRDVLTSLLIQRRAGLQIVATVSFPVK